MFLSRRIFRCPFIKEAQKHRDRANEVPGFEVSLKRLQPVAPRQQLYRDDGWFSCLLALVF